MCGCGCGCEREREALTRDIKVGSRPTVNLGNPFPSYNKNVIPVNHTCTLLHFPQTEARLTLHKGKEGKRTMLCLFLSWENSL